MRTTPTFWSWARSGPQVMQNAAQAHRCMFRDMTVAF
jgi:hypothetical protein